MRRVNLGHCGSDYQVEPIMTDTQGRDVSYSSYVGSGDRKTPTAEG
jgi:hypothetical protein